MLPTTMNNAMRLHLAQGNIPSSKFDGLDDVITGGAQAANDSLTDLVLGIRDRSEVMALRRQIEEVLKSNSGVLLIRVTKSVPDSAGNRTQTYIGMRVVGGGSSKASAIYAYERKKNDDDKQADVWPGSCSIAESNKQTGPTMRAAEPTTAYDQQVGEAEFAVRLRNPRNIDAGLFIAADTIEYTYVFFTSKEWADIQKGR